jgi:hypothetical protein
MSRKLIATLNFSLCATEGGLVLRTYWQGASQGAGAAILGLPPLRLGLLLVISLLTIGFLVLTLLEWRTTTEDHSPTARLLANRKLVFFATIIFTIGIFCITLFALSPLRSEKLYQYVMRFDVMIWWVILITAQLIAMTLVIYGKRYWLDTWQDIADHPLTIWLIQVLNSPFTGWAVLGLAFLLGLSKIWYGRFVDEHDNITVGWLLTEGYALYRDVFSHHFPFPYYWNALVISIFGNSFVAIRIALLTLQIGLFAIGMRITQFYLAIGLTALSWNLINQFHRGQEAIYASFEGIFTTTIFIIILWSLFTKNRLRTPVLVFLGILMALAILTDPLMVYPVGIALLALFVAGWQANDLQQPLQKALQAAFLPICMIIVVGGVYAGYLGVSGTAGDFYQSTFWFNSEIYGKYVDTEPLRLAHIGQKLLSGLDILDTRWYRELSPFLKLETYRSVKLENEHLYAGWLFSGFLFRLSILACVLGLALDRKYSGAIALFAFSASLMVRADDGLYAIGFTMLSLFAAFYLLTDLRQPSWLFLDRTEVNSAGKTAWQISKYLWYALLILIALMQLWSAFRGGFYLGKNWNSIMSKRHVKLYEKLGDDIHNLTCSQANVELSVFPINPIVHFVTEIPPASKYVFMYPWVAEIGQTELIAELREHPSAVVWINTARKSGAPDGVAAYMADTIKFLDEEYFIIGDDFWMSPELADICEPSKAQLQEFLGEEIE